MCVQFPAYHEPFPGFTDNEPVLPVIALLCLRQLLLLLPYYCFCIELLFLGLTTFRA